MKLNRDNHILKLCFFASLSLVFFTSITWGFAMIAVPPSGPYCPEGCMEYPFPDILLYYPRDYYWMYLSIFQLISYLVFITSVHFISEEKRKPYSFLGVVFSMIAATVLFITYFVQFTVVPISVMNGENEGIALITQYNDHGIFIAMEELGYIMMSLSFFFLGFSFQADSKIGKAMRIIMFVPLFLSVSAFIGYSIEFGIDRSYRFEVATISINWLAIIIIGILMSIHIKLKLKSADYEIDLK